jgi:hypothetical protein
LDFCNGIDPADSDGYFEAEYEAFVDAAACCTLAMKRERMSHMQFTFLRAALQALESVESSTTAA